MRAILLILILAVVVVLVAVGSGMVDINQTRGVKAPDIDASRNGVTAEGGQAPAFDIETGTVAVDAKPANVTIPVPSIRVNRPGGDAAQQPVQQNQAAPANAM